MNAQPGLPLLALVAAIALAGQDALGQQRAATQAQVFEPDPARPGDATENLPSATGAQASTPAGAVTGAGQPQGAALKELEYGAPGGLQQRARDEALGATSASGAGTAGGRGSGEGEAAAGDSKKHRR